MKTWQVIAAVAGGCILVLTGGLAITNPTQRDYEQYAMRQLSYHLRESVCNQLPAGFENLASECRSLGQTLIDTGRPQLQQIIFEQTDRQNYILFSTYRTQLSFSNLTPVYQFQSIGIAQQFFIYDIQEL